MKLKARHNPQTHDHTCSVTAILSLFVSPPLWLKHKSFSLQLNFPETWTLDGIKQDFEGSKAVEIRLIKPCNYQQWQKEQMSCFQMSYLQIVILNLEMKSTKRQHGKEEWQ